MNLRRITIGSTVGAALICGSLLASNSNSVDAATNTSAVHGILTTKYNGRGKIRLLDSNGKYMDQYVNKNVRYKVFEKGIINGRLMYRIGNDRQWIPSQLTNWPTTILNDTTAKKAVVTNRENISGVVTVTYQGPGKVRLLSSNHIYQNQYVGHGSNWKVFEKATIDGIPMYRIGSDNQWIPAKFVSLVSDKKNEENTSKKNNTDMKLNDSKSSTDVTVPSTDDPTNDALEAFKRATKGEEEWSRNHPVEDNYRARNDPGTDYMVVGPSVHDAYYTPEARAAYDRGEAAYKAFTAKYDREHPESAAYGRSIGFNGGFYLGPNYVLHP